MFSVVITEKGGAQRKMDFPNQSEVTIGRVQGNDIILPKGNVSKRHSRIVLKDNRFIVVDLKSTNGTYVNGRKITSPLVVKPGDKIYIGDFILTVEEGEGAGVGAEEPAPEAAAAAPESGPPPVQPEAGASARAPAPPPLPQRSPSQPAEAPAEGGNGQTIGPPPYEQAEEEPPAPPAAPQSSPPSGRPRNRTMEQAAPPPRPSAPAATPAAAPAPATAPKPQSPSKAPPRKPAPAPKPAAQAPAPKPPAAAPAVAASPGVAASVHAVLVAVASSIDIHETSPAATSDSTRWDEARAAIDQVVRTFQQSGQLTGDPSAVAGAALHEAVGFGPLGGLLDDETVREILVEGPSSIVVDSGNGLEATDRAFSSAAQASTVALRLMAHAGYAGASGSTHHFVLPGGAQVAVIMPPLAVRGPVIQVRKTPAAPSLDSLVARSVLSEDMASVLGRAVNERRNIVVTGPVGSGVTTLLSALVSLADPSERIVTAEDGAALAIGHAHVIALATGGPETGVRLRDVIRQTHQLRADRVVIDDVRDESAVEALAVLAARQQATLVGMHPAGHGLDGIRALARLDGAPTDAVDALLASGAQVLVDLGIADGQPRVVRVAEVGEAGGRPDAQDLFVYDGGFSATGQAPSF